MRVCDDKRLLVILGPTATGKSDLAMEIARRTSAEIISGDSLLVYRGLDIGTAKPTTAQRAEIPHHLIDIREPTQNYNVHDFQQAARELIPQINRRGKLPILVGGTGLYIKALLEGYEFGAKAGRAAELCYHAKIIGLNLARSELYRRIDARADKMLAQGLADEVRELSERGITRNAQAMQGIGYKEMLAHLAGEISLDEAATQIKLNTRHFAKRQLTWFRKMPYIEWYDADLTARNVPEKFWQGDFA